MATSKIKGGIEKVSTKTNGTVAGAANIVQLTIPSTGLYLITFTDANQFGAWFLGVTNTSSQDYHTGPAQIFTRQCTAGQQIYEQNLTGTAREYNAYFEAIRLM